MVEIIMPVYNTPGSLLQRSIEAVLNQTYKDWELWLINDGTTNPETIDVLKAYEGYPQIRLRYKKNGGVSDARNFALVQAGDFSFIAYCDSDDIWDPDHLEDSIRFLMSHNCDLVYCNPKIIDTENNPMIPTFKLFDHWDINNLKNNTNFIYISSVVHRNFKEYFDNNLNSIEDWDMWIRLASQGKFFGQKSRSTMTYLVGKGTGGAKGRLITHRLKAKHPEFLADFQPPPLKLNLGCGSQIIPGYINVDLYSDLADMKFDVAKLPIEDNTVDEIMAYHVIEHFDFHQTWNVLREWHRTLKPGGRLHIETPDFFESCRLFVQTNLEEIRTRLYGHFFAFPWEEGNVHKFLFTEWQLKWQLQEVGFKNIKRLPPDSTYAHGVINGGALPLSINNLSLFLNVEAFK